MTATSITLAAPAKINLFLRVLEREPGGYHRIETLFQRLALADDVTVAVTSGACALDVVWDGEPASNLGAAEKNLAWRAAQAYRDATGWPAGWDIRLTKRIPVGAGLGGGSADAAAVLRALDQLAPTRLGAESLTAIGARVGADVGFFAHDTSFAIGREHGDKLRLLPSLPPARVALAIPAYGISTADAYAALAASRVNVTAPFVAALRDTDDFGTWGAVARRQINDFETTVFAEHPDLAALRRWFEDTGASIARLSGSGSVVFGVWPESGRPTPSVKPPPGIRLLITKTA